MRNITAEKVNLQNFATLLGLTVHTKVFEDKRKGTKFFLTKNGTTISPVLDYDKLNHFLLGYSKAI